MAFVDLTKQLAQQALLSATQEPPPAPPAPENPGAVMLGQIGAMQKNLKDDEELVIYLQSGAERLRVMEIFLPSAHVAVLTGIDANRVVARVVVRHRRQNSQRWPRPDPHVHPRACSSHPAR